jgi:hypothetical protein
VSVTQAGGATSRLRGHEKNPFRQQHLAAQPSTATSTASSSSTAAGSGNGSATPAPSGGSGGGTVQPSPQTVYVYASVDVRFGHAGERLRRIGNVPRLTALPNAARPIVVFLGMRRDLATAVFLVSTDVHVQGLGQCVPSRKDCEAIALRAGDTALLDVRAADGKVTQYELDLDRVVLHRTTSKRIAEQAYARASHAGAALLRERVRTSADALAPPLRVPFRYVQQDGVLHIAPWAARRMRARAHDAFSAIHAVARAWELPAG